MNQTIQPLEPGIIKVTKEDKDYLGFKLSQSMKPDLAAVKRERTQEHGYLVVDGKVTHWNATGMLEYEGRYLIGPFHAGRSLMQTLDSSSPAESLRALHRLTYALQTLHKRKIELNRIDAAAIFLLQEGGLLFLPNSQVERFRNSLEPAYRFKEYETFNHPDLKGERNHSFTLACAAFKAVSGRHPFFNPEELPESEELHKRIRKGRHIPLHLLEAKIDEGVSEELSRILSDQEDPPGLNRMLVLLKSLEANLELETPGEELIIERRTAANRIAKKIESARKQEEFFLHHRMRLVIAAVILAVLGSVAGTIIGNLTEPPVTVGMSPREVVKLFYSSVNSFDHMSMEDCVTDGAGQEYLREATNLFVISRMRQGYEQGRNPYISAQEWIDNGRGPLPEGKDLYGIGNLEISEEEELIFRASYEKWIPFSDDSPGTSTDLRYSGELRLERLFLREEKGGYRIYRIELIESLPVETGSPEA